MIKLIVVLYAMLITIPSYADNDEVVGGIEVNGLTMCGKYTREQIFAALGGSA